MEGAGKLKKKGESGRERPLEARKISKHDSVSNSFSLPLLIWERGQTRRKVEWASDSTRQRNFRNIPPRFPVRLTAARAARARSKFSFAAPFRLLIFFRSEQRRSRGLKLPKSRKRSASFTSNSTVFIAFAFHTLDFIKTILSRKRKKNAIREPPFFRAYKLVGTKTKKLYVPRMLAYRRH